MTMLESSRFTAPATAQGMIATRTNCSLATGYPKAPYSPVPSCSFKCGASSGRASLSTEKGK